MIFDSCTVNSRRYDLSTSIHQNRPSDETAQYQPGKGSFTVKGGSITGDLEFVNEADFVPSGTIVIRDADIKAQKIVGADVTFENCLLTADTSENESMKIMAPKLKINDSQWYGDDLFLIASGDITNSKFVGNNVELEDCNFNFNNSQMDIGDLRVYVVEEINGSNIKWVDCSVKAKYIDSSIWGELGCSLIFDGTTASIDNGMVLFGDDAVESAPAAMVLDIKNNSKVTVNATGESGDDGTALTLFGNAKVTISDSEVILNGVVSAISGLGMQFDGTYYDPQLTLTGNIAIRDNGVYELKNHEPRITNSETQAEMKYAEIGKPRTSGNNFDNAYPIPALTGNKREDFVAIAKSQLGYSQSTTGETVYSDWADQSGRPWCSEFAAWCADQTGIAKSVFPKGLSTRKFRDFFEAQDRYYVMEGGCTPEGQDTDVPKIVLSEIQPGDLLLTESSGDYSDGPDHTAIFLSEQNGYMTCIAGNVNGTVAITIKYSEEIHGVCKPDFEKVTTGGGSGSGGSGGGSSSGRGGSGTQSGPASNPGILVTAASVYGGNWEAAGNAWRLKKADGTYAASQWGMVDGKWYLFDQQGYMANGWQQVNQIWYYFGVKGDMSLNWQMINEKWYCFNADGSMAANTTTADGYRVNSNGEWIQ